MIFAFPIVWTSSGLFFTISTRYSQVRFALSQKSSQEGILFLSPPPSNVNAMWLGYKINLQGWCVDVCRWMDADTSFPLPVQESPTHYTFPITTHPGFIVSLNSCSANLLIYSFLFPTSCFPILNDANRNDILIWNKFPCIEIKILTIV